MSKQKYPNLNKFMKIFLPLRNYYFSGNKIKISSTEKQLLQEALLEIGGSKINLYCASCVHDALVRLSNFYDNLNKKK
jgi:hypothetical protein